MHNYIMELVLLSRIWRNQKSQIKVVFDNFVDFDDFIGFVAFVAFVDLVDLVAFPLNFH